MWGNYSMGIFHFTVTLKKSCSLHEKDEEKIKGKKNI